MPVLMRGPSPPPPILVSAEGSQAASAAAAARPASGRSALRKLEKMANMDGGLPRFLRDMRGTGGALSDLATIIEKGERGDQ